MQTRRKGGEGATRRDGNAAAGRPSPVRVALVGGGHAHALVLRRWARRPPAGLSVTLIAPAPEAYYSGLLPAVVAGRLQPGAATIPLTRLAAAAGARFMRGRVVELDRAQGRVRLEEPDDAVPFDIVSLNIGAEGPTPPALAATTPVKPAAPFLEAWAGAAARAASGGGFFGVAVLGGGAAGVELALAMAGRLAAVAQGARVTLIEAGPRILPDLPAPAREVVRGRLAAARVTVRTGVRVTASRPGRLSLSDGAEMVVDAAFAATGARAAAWPGAAGLDCDAAGFVRVGPDLRAYTDPRVFAVGDGAAFAGDGPAKAGVYPVRQAPVLAENLVRAAQGRALRRFHPQAVFLRLIQTSDTHALAVHGRWWREARWASWWKARIDQGFVAGLRPQGSAERV